MAKVKTLGCNKIYLWTDKAPKFYEKLGFTYEGIVQKNHNEGEGMLYSKEV